MDITPHLKSKLQSFGALNYSPERIADLLGYAAEERRMLLASLARDDSAAALAYKQGQMICKYNIDAELAKAAEKGDIDAIKMLTELREKETLESIKKELFGI